MKVLVACEESQVITEQFILRGHDAMSCDLQLGAKGLPHYWGDVRDLLKESYDLVIFHPACTYLTNAGSRWLHERPNRFAKMKTAADFFNLRHKFNSPRVATENPIPHKYAVELIGKYDMTFQPWQHGERENKRSCLWLKGLPVLKPSNVVGPMPKNLPADQVRKWNRVHYCSPGESRAVIRSRTLEGVAVAMAEQWGALKRL